MLSALPPARFTNWYTRGSLNKRLKITVLATMLGILPLIAPGYAAAGALPVETAILQVQQYYTVSRHYGGLLAHLRTSQLGFEAGGVVSVVSVQEGDIVKQGDLLITLDNAASLAEQAALKAELASARASSTAQSAQLELAKSSLQRYQDLVDKGHGSVQRLDELTIQSRVDAAQVTVQDTRRQGSLARLDLATVRLKRLQIRAPFDGIVQTRQVDEGSIVAPGQTAMTLVEQGPLELKVGIPSDMVAYLRRESTYQFQVAGRRVHGKLKAILPVADQVTGTITAIFHIEDDTLYAGTVAELVLDAEVEAAGFWVSLSALSESQRGLWSVFVIKATQAGQVVETRLVEIIHRGDDAVYVRGTLRDGEQIVTGGTARIVPGQLVSISAQTPLRVGTRKAVAGE